MNNTKRWVQIFKLFANINRVKIVIVLQQKGRLTVTDVADELGVSLKTASKHLIMLDRFDVIDGQGKSGHVYYGLSPNMSADIKRSIHLFVGHK
jgi:DNA-binding transcriptional ArsR family regulator